MPNQSDSIEPLRFTVATDASLSSHERGRRLAILRDIEATTEKQGPHVSRPHANRARQFMPFAALKGYHELAHDRERTPEPKRAMTEELSSELSDALACLKKGCMVSVVHYEGDHYTTTCGKLAEINEAFHTLRVVKKQIAFDDIFHIETLGSEPASEK